jgi:hypothetical protein
MKTLSILCIALISTVSAWAQLQDDNRQVPKGAVGNSRTNVDFSKYKTFTWAQSDLTAVGPNGYDIYYYEMEPVNKPQKKAKNKSAKQITEPYIYSYSVIIPAKDETANGAITDAISNELEGRGYRENSSNGDLIVAYQVLDRPAKLHGYTNDDPAVVGNEEVRQPSDTATFDLEPGTLMVSLIDANTSQMVWTGFNPGMNENNAFITDEVKLKEAVHNIFDQFKYTADKASRE